MGWSRLGIDWWYAELLLEHQQVEDPVLDLFVLQHAVSCLRHSWAYSAQSTCQAPSHLLRGRPMGGCYVHSRSCSDSARRSVRLRAQGDGHVPERRRRLHCQRNRMLTTLTPTRAPTSDMESHCHSRQRPVKGSCTEVGRLPRRSLGPHLHRSAMLAGQRQLPGIGQQRHVDI